MEKERKHIFVLNSWQDGIIFAGRGAIWGTGNKFGREESSVPFWTCCIADIYETSTWKYKITHLGVYIRMSEKTDFEVEIWESSTSRDYLKSVVLDKLSLYRERNIGGKS